jgi:Zn-dependent oligopeptidase
LYQGLIDTAAALPKQKVRGKWVSRFHNSRLTALQCNFNRELRKQIWNAYQTRETMTDEQQKNAVV